MELEKLLRNPTMKMRTLSRYGTENQLELRGKSHLDQ